MGVVHFDIKPDNIMFSPTFNKMVFIDLGLSAPVEAEIGEKILTNFRGTLDYSSPEMVECF